MQPFLYHLFLNNSVIGEMYFFFFKVLWLWLTSQNVVGLSCVFQTGEVNILSVVLHIKSGVRSWVVRGFGLIVIQLTALGWATLHHGKKSR